MQVQEETSAVTIQALNGFICVNVQVVLPLLYCFPVEVTSGCKLQKNLLRPWKILICYCKTSDLARKAVCMKIKISRLCVTTPSDFGIKIINLKLIKLQIYILLKENRPAFGFSSHFLGGVLAKVERGAVFGRWLLTWHKRLVRVCKETLRSAVCHGWYTFLENDPRKYLWYPSVENLGDKTKLFRMLRCCWWFSWSVHIMGGTSQQWKMLICKASSLKSQLHME